MKGSLRRPLVGYAIAVVGVAVVAALIAPFYSQIRVLTAANMLLIVVLVVAMTWGMGPALLTSLLSSLYLNYFFVPPVGAFDLRINGSPDEVALAAFTITSVVVGRLFTSAQLRARENGRLYDELRGSYEQTTRLLDAIRRSERFKSALLDAVTHDLRNPLTSIKAASTAILDIRRNPSEPPSGKQATENDLLGIIVQQSDRLNHFIEGLIEMANFDAQGTQQTVVSTPVDEIIGAAIARAEDVLHGHSVAVQCEDNLQAAVNGRAIAQVLFSLMENAGKYSPPGSEVRIAAEYDPSGQVRIAVEDDGAGVPADVREKIFDKFFRGEPKDSGAVEGLGLGLTIARNIVEAHGGKIWVEELKSGRSGARFVFTLPSEGQPEPNPVAVVSEVGR